MKCCTLLIVDGYGENPLKYGNPTKAVKTPFFDYIKKNYPFTKINASEEFVGKLKGQTGDSEVGHTNIGAGRVVLQETLKINREIQSGRFFENKNILKTLNHVNKNSSNLHIMGLLSDGGVHSMIEHLHAFVKMAKMQGVKNIFIHIFTDGRDTYFKDGLHFAKGLQNFLKKQKIGKIASISGRFYSMDREQNYDRTKVFYDTLVNGKGEVFNSAEQAIKASYDKEIFDEYIVPCLIKDENGNVNTLKDGDSLILFNFRKDRPRQILSALSVENFDKFAVKKFNNLKILTPVKISEEFNNILYAFEQQKLNNTISEVISKNKFLQLKVAETTKYAHVTYYLNGTIEKPFEGEDRKLFVSDKIENFADAPKMQAEKIADFAAAEIEKNKYKLVVVNLANADMIGHTANFEACKTAVKTVDAAAKKIVDATLKTGGVAIVTADHGNIEKLIKKDGTPCSSHTTNKVMFVVVGEEYKNAKLESDGKLSDIAPTILQILNIKIPKEMDGKVLIKG